jgi:hypothetical protein
MGSILGPNSGPRTGMILTHPNSPTTFPYFLLFIYKPFIAFDRVLAYMYEYFSLCRPQKLGSHLPIMTKLVSLERSWPVEWAAPDEK